MVLRDRGDVHENLQGNLGFGNGFWFDFLNNLNNKMDNLKIVVDNI